MLPTARVAAKGGQGSGDAGVLQEMAAVFEAARQEMARR
jgi:hypothetical protein